jgi:ABC-2 type transport system ATP-binding protein
MLNIKAIAKTYGNGRGLRPLSLDVEHGEILCLVGPNGSGKSTALNIIAGVAKADSGCCLLDGALTITDACKKNIGFLEENPYYYEKISVLGFLDFIWGIKYAGESNSEIFRLLEKFDLLSMKNWKMRELSMGLRQRAGIITALMRYPDLIVLDEPTNGLDAKGVISLKEELAIAEKRGCHVIISSHMLDFIKGIGTRIVFIKDGVAEADIANSKDVDLDEAYKSLYM